MAEKSRIVLGTQVQIVGLSDWKDEEIVHLAMVAHEKMVKVHTATNWAEKYPGINAKAAATPPGVTTVLVVDNTGYISTSMKGGFFIYLAEMTPDGKKPANRYKYFDSKNPCAGTVQKALVNCKTAEGWGHRTGASCGEIWAAQAFCNTGSPKSLEGARVVTINTNKKKGDPNNGEPQIAHPCGDSTDIRVCTEDINTHGNGCANLKNRNMQANGDAISSPQSWVYMSSRKTSSRRSEMSQIMTLSILLLYIIEELSL